MLSLISGEFVFDPLYPDLGMAICSCMSEGGSSCRFGLLITERSVLVLFCRRRHFKNSRYTITRHE
jgi:hypothetical protein